MRKNHHTYRRWLITGGITVLLLALCGAGYWLHVRHDKPKPVGVTGNAYTKGIPNSTNQSSSSSGSGATTGTGVDNGKPLQNDDNGTGNSTTSEPLTAPWGTFVNEYNVKSTDQMGSTCNTTPGATCNIAFFNGTITKSLTTETTDVGGAAYWSWTPAQIGLMPGTWHILVTATLGSQSKVTNNDPLVLTVSQ